MKPVRDIKPVHVPARTVHCIEGGNGLQITAVTGTVWVTQARDPRDVILSRGQSFILDRKGRAVVYALNDAAIVVGPAGHITAADFAAPAPEEGVGHFAAMPGMSMQRSARGV
jgi:Protein of unknown function (DUF2917)